MLNTAEFVFLFTTKHLPPQETSVSKNIGCLPTCFLSHARYTVTLHIFPSPDMADDDVTTEQLAAIAAENEEPEPVNYKPPAQKSVKEIHELDKDDESLRKYKEALLGPGISEAGNTLCVSECVCVCVFSKTTVQIVSRFFL